MLATARRFLAPLALVSATLVACAAGSDRHAASGGGGDGQGGNGSGGVDGDIDLHAGPGGPGGSLDACASTGQDATLVPVSMFVMIDKSASMAQSNKWKNAKAAFKAFFQDPAAADLAVALRFFPDTGCDGTSCSVDVCSQPAVDAGPLSDPAHVHALVAALDAHSPDGFTPMSAALGGAEKWAQGRAGQAMGAEKVVVVLVTDGEPNGCDENVDHIAGEAADAFSAAGVVTFAVGLAGSAPSTIDAIAAAGHSTQGFFIGNGNAEADLVAALETIHQSTVGCSYQMPEAEPGQVIDPMLVNVSYTPAGGSAETLGQVSGAAACGAKGGWYYDDASHPTTITLCPSTCQTVQSSAGAKMQVQLGCKTQPA